MPGSPASGPERRAIETTRAHVPANAAPTMSQISISSNLIKAALSRFDLSAVRAPLMLSLLNQMVSSGGNFLVGIYLARTLSLEGFGLYGIGFGICMLYVGIGNAVILTQMVVNMPDKSLAEKENYAAKMLYAVLMLGGVVLAVAASALALAAVLMPAAQRLLATVLAIGIASIFFLCNEFFISYAYLKRRESLALKVNLTTMFVLFSGLALEKLAGIALVAEHVLLLYALGAGAGSCLAYAQTPLTLRGNAGGLAADLREAWRHGRWALGGVAVTWLQSQAYTYVLAFFLGAAGVGRANAARIFISPFSFLLPAINKVAIPRLADLRNSDPKKMLRISLLLTAGLSLLVLLYSMLLLGSLEHVSPLILGRHDVRIDALVWVWCVVLTFQMIRSGGGVLLQVQRKFRRLMLLNLPSAAITIGLAILLMQWLGAAGAIWGMAAGELVLSLLIWREIKRESTDEN